MSRLSLRRKDSSTAFFNHWLTFHEFGPVAPAIFSATRALPESIRSSAFSTASRTSRSSAARSSAILEGALDQRLKLGVGHEGSWQTGRYPHPRSGGGGPCEAWWRGRYSLTREAGEQL